jgi:polysaccharide pyruvyl transferase WcaK-like protein
VSFAANQARRSDPPRLCIIGDVAGEADYHLGDEAMLEANLARFTDLLPKIRFTVFSRDPDWTSVRYGVDAVRTPRFPPGVTAGHVRALRASDGLVISGGGNLSSTWPEKVRERAALIDVAAQLQRPVVVVGQTLGPVLTGDDAALLAGALRVAAWVGVRDDESVLLARRLGVAAHRVHRQLDDAFFMAAEAVADERFEVLRRESRPLVLVTLDGSFGTAARRPVLHAMAAQLDALADLLGAALVFVPHVGGGAVEAAHSDEVAGRALAACLRSPLHLIGLWQPREARWLTERAALVISTRYHPVVFATAACIPALAIHQDDYTRIKLRGALAGAGLQGWCLGIADAERGALLPLAAELWHQREAVAASLHALHEVAWSRDAPRWSGICAALNLTPGRPATPPALRTSAATVRSTSGGTDLAHMLTDAQWQQFDRDGYLLLGRVLDNVQLEGLRTRIDDIMLGRVRYPALQLQLDTGGRYEDLPDPVSGLDEATLAYRKVQGLEADPLVLDLVRHEWFREFCARVYGRHASISIFRAMLMNKPAGKGTHLPWHQDAGDVWKLDRDPILTSWIALDPATRQNGCLQVIPGSHRLGLLSKNGSTLSDADATTHCPDGAIVHLEIGAGEAVVLHNWMLHRSGINTSAIPRRALSACYMDARTLDTVSGTRFPVVFGEYQDVEAGLPFVRDIRAERQRYAEMAAESERYAKSLLADNEQREVMRGDAERYARSLEEELVRMRGANH